MKPGSDSGNNLCGQVTVYTLCIELSRVPSSVDIRVALTGSPLVLGKIFWPGQLERKQAVSLSSRTRPYSHNFAFLFLI